MRAMLLSLFCPSRSGIGLVGMAVYKSFFSGHIPIYTTVFLRNSYPSHIDEIDTGPTKDRTKRMHYPEPRRWSFSQEFVRAFERPLTTIHDLILRDSCPSLYRPNGKETDNWPNKTTIAQLKLLVMTNIQSNINRFGTGWCWCDCVIRISYSSHKDQTENTPKLKKCT